MIEARRSPTFDSLTSRNGSRPVSTSRPARIPRTSSSRVSTYDGDFANITPAPKKRGRPFKNPALNMNGSTPGSLGKSKSSSKVRSEIKVHARRIPICSFCGGSDTQNRAGKPERMISCTLCGRSGHRTCLSMHEPLYSTVLKYDWHCMECKRCEICHVKGDDVSLLSLLSNNAESLETVDVLR